MEEGLPCQYSSIGSHWLGRVKFDKIDAPVTRTLLVISILVGWVVVAGAQPNERKKSNKKKKEPLEITQTLEAIPEPPPAVSADVGRLVFYVSPLSGKGLLSQQTRDAVKALRGMARGNQIVKIRAFVAGTGDLRRIGAIVGETFGEARLPIPSVSVILVGALPLQDAQVVLEAAAVDKKTVNPNGLGFFSGQLVRATEEKPRPLMDVVSESVANLEKALAASGASADGVLRTTCFVSVLEPEASALLARKFPKSASTVVQLQRATGPSLAECEAVARLNTAPTAAVEHLNPEGLEKSPNYTQVTRVRGGKLVFTTTQQAFGSEPADFRLALQRLAKMLESQQAGITQVVMAHGYALSTKAIEGYRGVRMEFYEKGRPPASTLLIYEGLPSSEARFGLDVIAAVP